MQPAFRAFAHGIEPVEIGATGQIDQHAAAGIMLCGDDRDRLAGHVDAQAEQPLVDIGEMAADELRVLVADIEVHVIEPEALDLVVDGAGDDIARGQFLTWVEARHEALAAARNARRQLQVSALAAHGLGNEEVLDLQIVKAGRVELHEFHVGDAAARAPGHGDAVSGRAARGGAEQIGAARTAGGEDRGARGKAFDPAGGGIQRIGAPDALRTVCLAAALGTVTVGDKIDRHHVGAQGDVGMGLCGGNQRLLHGPAGGVVHVHDPAV